MTTDHDLLARIEAKSLDIVFQLGYGVMLEKDQTLKARDGNIELRKALRAVVEREEKKHNNTDSFNVELYKGGYNQCLAEIKADIAKNLEKAGE